MACCRQCCWKSQFVRQYESEKIRASVTKSRSNLGTPVSEAAAAGHQACSTQSQSDKDQTQFGHACVRSGRQQEVRLHRARHSKSESVKGRVTGSGPARGVQSCNSIYTPTRGVRSCNFTHTHTHERYACVERSKTEGIRTSGWSRALSTLETTHDHHHHHPHTQAGWRSTILGHPAPFRVRVTGSRPTKGMPVLSAVRQSGSSSAKGTVTKGTPLRTVLSHPTPTPPRQPGRENQDMHMLAC
eukprot:363628-Chlamydomonas_euryale.AAC.7